jgi:hypothetical protein
MSKDKSRQRFAMTDPDEIVVVPRNDDGADGEESEEDTSKETTEDE